MRGAGPDEDLVDLAGMARGLWAGRRWIAAIMAACLLLGAVQAFIRATPVYTAASVVMLESRDTSVAGLDSVLGELATGTTSVVRTEIEVLRSRNLVAQVVAALDLTRDPEFNAALRAPSLWARFLGLFTPDRPDTRSAAERERATLDGTVSAVLGAVEVENVSGSLVFRITARSLSAERARLLADEMARAYVDDQRRYRYETTQAAASWLTGELADLQAELETAETAVRRFQAATSLIDAESLGAMDRQLKETRARRDGVAGDLAALSAQIAALPEGAPARARLQADAARLEAQARSLSMAVEGLMATIEGQSQDLIRLDQLKREAESSRLLYEHFQARLKETTAQLGLQQADSRVLSQAVLPDRPSAPRKGRILAISGLLGLLLGVVFVVIRDQQTRRIRSARALEALTGQIVLSQIPVIPAKGRQASISWLQANPTSAPAEAIRNLRTSILLGNRETVPQVLTITSANPEEGKTTVAAALAQNMARMGRRVLLIEGDVRNRTLSRSLGFGEAAAVGLSAGIAAPETLPRLVQAAPWGGDVLLADRAPVDTVDLFASDGFAALIATARGSYDMVLIDTPPVLAVPDARVIAQASDAVLFVVRWNRTLSDQVTEALGQLDSVHARVAGLVVTQVTAEGLRHYGYGYGQRYGQE